MSANRAMAQRTVRTICTAPMPVKIDEDDRDQRRWPHWWSRDLHRRQPSSAHTVIESFHGRNHCKHIFERTQVNYFAIYRSTHTHKLQSQIPIYAECAGIYCLPFQSKRFRNRVPLAMHLHAQFFLNCTIFSNCHSLLSFDVPYGSLRQQQQRNHIGIFGI